MTFKNGVLTGTAHCVHGPSLPFRAAAANDALVGRVGALPLAAVLKRDPPPPGTPKPLAPTSVAGTYSFAPTSTCLGGSMILTESGSNVSVKSGNKPRGSARVQEREPDRSRVVRAQRWSSRAASATPPG